MDSSLIKANASKDSFRLEFKDTSDYLSNLANSKNMNNKYTGKHFDGVFNPNKMGARRKRKRKTDIYKWDFSNNSVILSV